MIYSTDFRKKVLLVKKQEKTSFSKVSKRFGVGIASIVRWSKQIESKKTRNKGGVKWAIANSDTFDRQC